MNIHPPAFLQSGEPEWLRPQFLPFIAPLGWQTTTPSNEESPALKPLHRTSSLLLRLRAPWIPQSSSQLRARLHPPSQQLLTRYRQSTKKKCSPCGKWSKSPCSLRIQLPPLPPPTWTRLANSPRQRTSHRSQQNGGIRPTWDTSTPTSTKHTERVR